MKSHLSIVMLALVCATGAQAQTQATAPNNDRALQGYVAAGLTAGGETLATVVYTDGHTQDIKSGGLLELVGGFDYHPDQAPLSLRGSLAYHVSDSSAKNGSVKFDRWPVELLAFWNASDKFRLGLGMRKALGPRLTSSGAASNIGQYNLGSKVGFVIEGEYRYNPKMGVSLRYVTEKYTTSTAVGGSISGNHVGVRGGFYF